MKVMLRRIIDSLWTNVWTLDGLEASTNENLKIIFAGDEREKFYFLKIAFNNNCQEIPIGRMSLLKLYYLIVTNKYNCSLAIIECFVSLSNCFGKGKRFLYTITDTPHC